MSGYVHLYTGNGKGKTTAAFGLAVRALCAGKRVYIGQFVKSMKYSETRLEEYFPDQLTIEQLGSGCFLTHTPSEQDQRLATAGLEHCAKLMREGAYDVVIMDELTIALHFKLITVGTVIQALRTRETSIEVVITGRYAPDELIEYADLVTEMQEVKHYYQAGVLSREGIDR
ncbi:MAG: cob(I)yrinic acid a,c-diamide adenosyltransferase [Porphyromonas sp.]|nr:cob(I)yrinic acid a,c-diamide adenosyltransferase [Porphyromonas sp.]